MVKHFRVLMLMALIMPVIAFSGCGPFKKAKNDSLNLLLLAPGEANTGTVTLSVGKFVNTEFRSTGFGNAGGVQYQQRASRGTAQFYIVFTDSHTPGAYDQNKVDITFVDSTGQGWNTVSGRSFTLNLSSWPGVGGFATGTFSGTLENVMNSSLTLDVSSSSFKVKILN
jgi:hypothetical protein